MSESNWVLSIINQRHHVPGVQEANKFTPSVRQASRLSVGLSSGRKARSNTTRWLRFCCSTSCFTVLQQLRSLAPGCGREITQFTQFKVVPMNRQH